MLSSRRRFARLTFVPTVAAALVVGLATSASAQPVRLDVSNSGWVGYAELEITKRGSTSHIYGTLHKVSRGKCLILEADDGALSGSTRIKKRCKPGTSRINTTTGRDRLVLRSPKNWAPDPKDVVEL
ncbi:hypothetical protein [Streptomyces formicae]